MGKEWVRYRGLEMTEAPNRERGVKVSKEYRHLEKCRKGR